MTKVGGWVKVHVSSQKNLSQKEAEFILVGKEDGWSHLFLQDRDHGSQNPEYWVHLCMYSLICFESINQNFWS